MPSEPLDLRAQAFGRCNLSAGHVVRQRRVALTSPVARVSSLPSLARIWGSFWPEIDGNGRYETAVDRGDSILRARPILITGLLVKRVMDLLLSAIGVLLLWPFLLAIALAVKLESAGPVIYASLRAGKKGQKFVCYKFRTMVDGADGLKDFLRQFNERQDPFFKIADDPRVTRLGRFLRKYSLDELPQLWNVLKGDMSLVGPRPHPVDDYARYRPEDHRRLDVKPGITGLWQVIARTDPSFETCMTLDLEYVKNWSLMLDFRILMWTAPAVLAGAGS
ncbi:MAG TPA: sugar transferase [Candidatus Acidoferrales bacterium]|nr:sugar transferase [Candidatus Acidoferrales bacterium]